jgi:hypothetical protein
MPHNLQLDIFKGTKEQIRFAPYIKHLESEFREEVERVLETGVAIAQSNR